MLYLYFQKKKEIAGNWILPSGLLSYCIFPLAKQGMHHCALRTCTQTVKIVKWKDEELFENIQCRNVNVFLAVSRPERLCIISNYR